MLIYPRAAIEKAIEEYHAKLTEGASTFANVLHGTNVVLTEAEWGDPIECDLPEEPFIVE